MGFNPITYALIKKESERASTGISNVSVSDNGKSIIFTETNGNKLSISQSDWEALTPEEREKISKLIITGLGDSVLCDDGVYRSFIPKSSYNYNDIEEKPSINNVILEGNKTLEELKFSEVSKTGLYNSLTGLPNIPNKVSDVTNNSAFITRMVNDLVNYYNKASIYTKQESENLISQAKTFSVEIVEELPTNNISSTVIYLMKESGSGFYTQWIYVENAWITIGSTEIDMSNFYTIAETDTLVDGKVNKVEGYGLSQENFSPENKDKLETYQEYKPSIISKNNLGILRVDGETIVIKNGVLSSPSGGGGMEPLNVANINIESSDRTLTIKWKDPDDRIISGQTVSKWKGTKLVYKADSYPKNESDGILAVDNTIRNQYENDGFIVSGLTNGVTYYFQLFPYSDTMVYNKNVENRFEGIPEIKVNYRIMTAIIDTSNSNPETCVTYEDDAINMSPKSEEWDVFFGEYPCLFKDGSEFRKLNPNNFTLFENNNSADITSGTLGDVMICFPRRGLRIENDTLNKKIKISMTDNPNDSRFKYYAHSRGSNIKDNFYLGTYLGVRASSPNGFVLRSLSGGESSGGYGLDGFRTYANNMGGGYNICGFYQRVFLQSAFILKNKGLDSQKYLGQGAVGSTKPYNGTTNKMGMNVISSNYNIPNKMLGIENIYGTNLELIDGIFISEGKILTATEGFNSAGNNYEEHGSIIGTANVPTYISETIGTSELGFLPSKFSGSATTYYCDSGMTKNMTKDDVMCVGGWAGASNVSQFGIFYNNIFFKGGSNVVARLMYL